MKILLLSSHSDNNLDLAVLSARNHWEYGARWHYDYMVVREMWDECLKNFPEIFMKLLPFYDAILSLGSDVLFTNFDISAESILQPGDCMVVAKEPSGNSTTINLGVILLCNHPQTFELLKLIDRERQTWLKLRLIAQDWMSQNYNTPLIKNSVRIVPTRVMNSTVDGDNAWKSGDWLVHFYCHKQEEKKALIEKFIKTNLERL